MADSTAPVKRWSLAVGGLSLVWGGFLAGVSMLATPVKFSATTLALPVALEVGRVTFAALIKVEIAAAILLLVLVFWLGRRTVNVAGALLLAALVATQLVWLLPALDARVATIMAGGTPPASSLHLLYVAAEGIKLLLLAVLGVANLRGAGRR